MKKISALKTSIKRTINTVNRKTTQLFDELIPGVVVTCAVFTMYLYGTDQTLPDVVQSMGFTFGLIAAIVSWIGFFYIYPINELVDNPRSYEYTTLINAVLVHLGAATAIAFAATSTGLL